MVTMCRRRMTESLCTYCNLFDRSSMLLEKWKVLLGHPETFDKGPVKSQRVAVRMSMSKRGGVVLMPHVGEGKLFDRNDVPG